MNDEHQLALIEAGISRPGEMEKLQNMIKPTIGIFTNIGSVHDENFLGSQQKVEEKLKLFLGVDTLIYCKDFSLIHDTIQRTLLIRKNCAFLPGRKSQKRIYRLAASRKAPMVGNPGCLQQPVSYHPEFPFTDDASVDNAITAGRSWLILAMIRM